ncbi:MAG: hypothetical protein LDL33_00390 [Desulfomonile sp.]|nr:hypothetical protein [Desulfomonile sp.]
MKSAQLRHEELLREGWTRRFNTDEPRLSEMKQYYESLGFEVRVEPGIVGDENDCTSCFGTEGLEERYSTLYTRGRSRPTDNDLFE